MLLDGCCESQFSCWRPRAWRARGLGPQKTQRAMPCHGHNGTAPGVHHEMWGRSGVGDARSSPLTFAVKPTFPNTCQWCALSCCCCSTSCCLLSLPGSLPPSPPATARSAHRPTSPCCCCCCRLQAASWLAPLRSSSLPPLACCAWGPGPCARAPLAGYQLITCCAWSWGLRRRSQRACACGCRPPRTAPVTPPRPLQQAHSTRSKGAVSARGPDGACAACNGWQQQRWGWQEAGNAHVASTEAGVPWHPGGGCLSTIGGSIPPPSGEALP